MTRTAALHARAWKRLFDEFLARLEGDPERLAPFRLPEDYFAWVDGKPRYEGVRSFLQSRAIDLPWGDPQDSPDARTVCGLANRKDCYSELLSEQGGGVSHTIALIRAARSRRRDRLALLEELPADPGARREDRAVDAIFDGRDLNGRVWPASRAPDAFLSPPSAWARRRQGAPWSRIPSRG